MTFRQTSLFLIFAFLICLIAGAVNAANGELNTLVKIDYTSPAENQTLVRFHTKSKPDYEMFENLDRQIFVIKMRNSQIPDNRNYVVFKDELVSGYMVQRAGENAFFVKLRTEVPDLLFKVLPSGDNPNLLSVLFYTKTVTPVEKEGIEVVNILRELTPEFEKLYIFAKEPLQHDVVKEKTKPGKIMKIRLYNAKLQKDLVIPSAQTEILKQIKLEERGSYISLVLEPKTYALNIDKEIMENPFRLVFTIRENRDIKVTDPDPMELEKEKEEQEEKLEKEKRDRFLTKLLNDAEKFYKIGRFEQAALKFKNIYNYAPESEIGIRAAFRAADSLFQKQRQDPVRGGERFVNQEYMAAINAVLVADKGDSETPKGYDEIPRAYYNMGRNYLNLRFYEDAYNQFEILIQNYPESPYAKTALFHQGVIHLNMERYSKSVEGLERFVEENPKSSFVHAAYYKIGEALFQMKKYREAKESFDKAWSLDADYMKRDPELMFHMGEAYFENQEFKTARAIYEELIDLYPRETFSNLVAIRIGDFLREENKHDDAIKAYEKAINRFPNELLLIGRMRIANILAERPNPEDYKKALDIYDFIIEKHVLSDQVKEAMLRKALTLSLFHHFEEAIAGMETFCREYPENIYVANNIIHQRVMDTIRAYIADYYFQGKHLDALGVYEQYEKDFFLRPENGSCFQPREGERRQETVERLSAQAPLFLISDSYYRLGLYDKALEINKLLLRDEANPLVPTVLFNQGKIYDAKEQPEKAQEEYTRFIARYSDHVFTPLVKKALGDSYFKVHKPDRISRAIRIYRQTIRDYQDSESMLEREIVPECWFALGNLYQGIGQYDDSINAYKNVLNFYEHPLQGDSVDEYVIDTHFILGNLYLELNQLPEALETYNRAIDLFPESEQTPWAKYYKGEIFIKNNQKDRALEIFAELIEESKDHPNALWGPLAEESHKAILSDLQFDKYLQRTPSATNVE